MIDFKNIEIRSRVFFGQVNCPVHKIQMFELDDNWISKCWFCPKCAAPYTLEPVKMKKWNKKALREALKH